MKIWTVVIAFLLSASADAGIFEKDTQDCVITKLSEQFPRMSDLPLEFGGVFGEDDNNWEAMIVTKFSDGGSDRVFVSVKNGDFLNASLLVDGLQPQRVNLVTCF